MGSFAFSKDVPRFFGVLIKTAEQLLNMLLALTIPVHFNKSKLERSTVLSDVQPLNIDCTFVSSGGYVFGVGSTILSFVILGNYSMGIQMEGRADFISEYINVGDLYGMIINMFETLPLAPVVLVVLLLTMVAFYSTSFDSIALTASCYSYKEMEESDSPSKIIQLIWCILLILFPMALVFSESSMSNLQSVSIVAAFPIGFVMIMIVASFLKDAKKYMEE